MNNFKNSIFSILYGNSPSTKLILSFIKYKKINDEINYKMNIEIIS